MDEGVYRYPGLREPERCGVQCPVCYAAPHWPCRTVVYENGGRKPGGHQLDIHTERRQKNTERNQRVRVSTGTTPEPSGGRTGTLVGFVENEVEVDCGVFGLVDLDTDGCPNPWPGEDLPPNQRVWAQFNRVDFCSAARLQYAAVRMEAWDGEPADVPAAWGLPDAEVDFPSTSAEVELCELAGGGPGETLTLGPAGWLYRLRVYTQGRDEALKLYLEEGMAPDGTEKYLLVFWPHRAITPEDLVV